MSDESQESQVTQEQAEDAGNTGGIPEAAKAILDEVRSQAKAEATQTPPNSQPEPDPRAAAVAQRESFKKQMNFSEEQMQVYERNQLSAQEPLIFELAVSKVEKNHKDYDQLKQPFMDEMNLYRKRGVIINQELADQIYLMVKGRELEAGRYSVTPPSSQPANQNRSSSASSSAASARRIASGYNPSDPGVGGGSSSDREPDDLSDREKVYADVLNVDAKDYKKMKEDKVKGIREIASRSWRAPEIDTKTAGPADRDLAALWGKNGGRI